jgi:hypothetical protein
MGFLSILHCMAGVLDNLLGIAISLLGRAFHLQLDTFNFLRFAVYDLACGFLYFASDVFYLALDLVFVHEVSFGVKWINAIMSLIQTQIQISSG